MLAFLLDFLNDATLPWGLQTDSAGKQQTGQQTCVCHDLLPNLDKVGICSMGYDLLLIVFPSLLSDLNNVCCPFPDTSTCTVPFPMYLSLWTYVSFGAHRLPSVPIILFMLWVSFVPVIRASGCQCFPPCFPVAFDGRPSLKQISFQHLALVSSSWCLPL